MEKTTNNQLLPADTGPQRAPISEESEGPVSAGKKTSPSGHRPDAEVPQRPVRRSFLADYKLQILRQADACTQRGQVGQLLRREGLYSSHLTTWRAQRQQGTLDALAPKKRGRKTRANDPALEKSRCLERENKRLRERLWQAEVIIDIQKKLRQAKLGKGGCFMTS
jgi:transposase